MARYNSLEALTLRVRDIREGGDAYEVEVGEVELGRLLQSAETGYHTAGRPGLARLQVSRIGENVFVRGAITFDVRCVCGRCLAELKDSRRVDIHWTFLPVAAYQATYGADELELTSDDLDVSFYEGDTIDIADIVREALALDLDAYPVCPDGCAESVGWTDAAQEGESGEAAAGESEPLDPRWLPLMAVKAKLKSS